MGLLSGGGVVCVVESASSVSALGMDDDGNGFWISTLQPLLVPSTSNPSRRTRILPHESQFGGIKALSLSMTLCLSACFLSSECMPRVE